MLATSAPKKGIIWNLTLPVQFSPPHAGKGQIPHSPGTEDSQMPVVCSGGGRGGGGGGNVEVSMASIPGKMNYASSPDFPHS